MVRTAFKALQDQYSDDEAIAVLHKLISFAPENVQLSADFKMTITERAGA